MAGKMSIQNARSLRAVRDRIQSDLAKAQGVVDSLQGELRATDRAIAIVEGQEKEPSEAVPNAHERRASRGSVKDAVLGLVGEHISGLKTTDVVELAKERGIELDRNSVASLLSRLAREGVLLYNRETRRYSPMPRPIPPLRSVS